jgi:DNA-binding protein HU-beta
LLFTKAFAVASTSVFQPPRSGDTFRCERVHINENFHAGFACVQDAGEPFILLSETCEGPMNKTELIDHIAKHADISKAAAGRSLDALVGAVKSTLKKNGTVTLVGFGTFAVTARAARTGRNPRTGEAIKIKKAKVPKFRPGKALKDAVN